MTTQMLREIALCFLPVLAAAGRLFCNGCDTGPRAFAQKKTQYLPILAYHKVAKTPAPCSSIWVTRQVFAGQMAALHAYGYTALSFRDIVNFQTGGTALPPRPVILTFDDGYECVYSVARPILNKYGFKAACFLSTDYIGAAQRRDNSWDSGCPSSMMLWAEAAAMLAEGHSFEGHTLSHPRLSSLHPVQAYREIAGSKREIENRLGAAVTCFAYPFGAGAGNPLLRFLAAQAGYKAAASYKTGIASLDASDIMALPRIKIMEENSVYLDPSHPENFFMRVVDPGFELPNISIDHIEIADARDNSSRAVFAPGETLSIRVYASNSGTPVNVTASLSITGGSGTAATTLYESHPAADSAKKPFACGNPEVFSYALRVPADAAAGTYRLRFSVHDEQYVLEFFTSGTELRIAP
jgi:peptidoglycan/xylan/chitin deacetylase (PgdA/CDA1 family)